MTRQPMPPAPQLIEEYAAQELECAITAVTPLSYDGRKNRVRMKNQIQNVARTTEERFGQRPSQGLRKRLEEIAEDLRLVQRPASWCVLTDGDALQSVLVPAPFPERLIVDTRYYLRPLIQAAVAHGEFLLLALSQGDVRLYRMSGERMTEQPLDGLPSSLSDVVGHEVEAQALQHHTAGGTMFHAQGKGHDDRDAELERFLQAVDRAINDDLKLREEHLIIAAVEELDALYRQLSQHRLLLPVPVRLSPGQIGEEELRVAAAEAFAQWRRDDDKASFEALHEDAHHASDDLETIVRASIEGRVDTLIADAEQSIWGRFDEDAWAVRLHDQQQPDSRDLIDSAMCASWRQGGHVRIIHGEQREAIGMSVPLIARLRY